MNELEAKSYQTKQWMSIILNMTVIFVAKKRPIAANNNDRKLIFNSSYSYIVDSIRIANVAQIY